MPRKIKKNINKIKTKGYIKIVLHDGLILVIKNLMYQDTIIKKMVKTQPIEEKEKLLYMVNRRDENPKKYNFKRRQETLVLVHVSRDIDEWE